MLNTKGFIKPKNSNDIIVNTTYNSSTDDELENSIFDKNEVIDKIKNKNEIIDKIEDKKSIDDIFQNKKSIFYL